MLDNLLSGLQELFQRKAEEGHVKENFLQTQLAGKEKEVCSAKELVESLRIEMTELLVELHSTRDKIDGAQKEVIAIRGVCQQQSEHIDQVLTIFSVISYLVDV